MGRATQPALRAQGGQRARAARRPRREAPPLPGQLLAEPGCHSRASSDLGARTSLGHDLRCHDVKCLGRSLVKQLQRAQALGAQRASSPRGPREDSCGNAPARTADGSTPSTSPGREGGSSSVTACSGQPWRGLHFLLAVTLSHAYTHTPCAHTPLTYTHSTYTTDTHTHPFPGMRCTSPVWLPPLGNRGRRSCSHRPLEPAGARRKLCARLCSSTPQPQTHCQAGGRLRRCLPENLLPKEPETLPPASSRLDRELCTLCRVTG